MLTYGGVPLLIPDDGGDLVRFLEANLPLEDTRAFCEVPAAIRSSVHTHRSRFETNKGLGLPILNYPPPPPPRINSLWQPSTGATRWARGYFLATKAAKDQITAMAHSAGGSTALELKFGDDVTPGALDPIGGSFYLLPPHPISAVDPTKFGSDDTLWLLPLVDERYWWQYLNVDDLEISCSTTWATLFSTLGTAIGKTISVSAVDAAYGKPDPIDFTRRYENAAVLLDAAAASIGRRVVISDEGAGVVTVTAQTPAEALAKWQLQEDSEWRLIAGGDNSDENGDLPEKVLVTFRKIRQYLLRSDGQKHTIEKDAAEGSTATASGKNLLIHSAAYADYSSADVLLNESFLDALATKIRDDWFAWKAKSYDKTFVGAQAVRAIGFTDAITWDWGRPIGHDGRLSAVTRVSTLPANFGAEVNLCQDQDRHTLDLPPAFLGTLQGTLDACDLTADDIVDVTAMPTTTTTISITNQVGTDVGWTEKTICDDPASLNIYNPTPFLFSSGDIVWAKNAGEHYVVERAHKWKPFSQFTTVGGLIQSTVGASHNVSFNGHYGFGNVASYLTTVATIECPVNGLPFRISWGGNAEAFTSGTITDIKWNVGVYNPNLSAFRVMAIPSKGPATAGGDSVLWGATIDDHNSVNFSGSYVLSLSQGDQLGVRITASVTGGGSIGSVQCGQAWLLIEPLF